jgi:hypothetical protein
MPKLFLTHLNAQWNPVNTVNDGPEKYGRINGTTVLMGYIFVRKCIVLAFFGDNNKWP